MSALPIEISEWKPAPFDLKGETVFAIGDVHGEIEKLDQLLAYVREDARFNGGAYRIVFLGDLIDRGPDSRSVVERALSATVAGEAIDRAAYDTHGFRFGKILDYRDPMFLPGGAKYLDLPGMIQVQGPYLRWVRGEGKDPEAGLVEWQQGTARGATVVQAGADEHARELGINPATSMSGPFSMADETVYRAMYLAWQRRLQEGEQAEKAADKAGAKA